MTTFKSFIAGEWVESSTGEYVENRNPADTRDLIGLFPKGDASDVNLVESQACVHRPMSKARIGCAGDEGVNRLARGCSTGWPTTV